MGWSPADLGKDEYLILSTQGGIRAEDGSPIALGYHTGHYEVGLLAQAAASEFKQHNAIPFAGFVSDPCDGRTQGTSGMMDSLAYRNDAATVLRRLIRSLPTRRGVLGIATCDKGLPAMMIALAAQKSLPCVIVPGGVTLLPEQGEDAGKIQSLGARFAHGLITLEEASDLGCRACASPGGGCQVLGTAATSQVVAEALGLAVTHSAWHRRVRNLARRGEAIRACIDRDVSKTSPPATFSLKTPFTTPWSHTPRLAEVQIYCCTSLQLRMLRNSRAPAWTIGYASIAPRRVWWMSCRMDRQAMEPCRSSLPAVCLK
jgi:dihydroxyacid dehydratase/phosphogluconate dehydratase